MDRLSLLKSRKDQLRQEGDQVRKKIFTILDGESFVELQSCSFSKNEFYGQSAYGEGVVTGFATINDMPIYVVAINDQILNGGLGLNACKKIVNCMEKAKVSGSPILYLVSSEGILAGEGVDALEGVAMLLSKAEDLKGVVPQFAVCYGKVLGSATLLVASCDYVYYTKDACVAFNSPLVISAKSNINYDQAKIGGYDNGNGICSFYVEDLEQVRGSITEILETLPDFGGIIAETNDDYNRASINLNDKVCAKCLKEAVFDNGKFIEFGKNYAKEVITGIGRVGGISVASIIFDGENGVELTNTNISKIEEFIYYATNNALPMVIFTNTLGVKQDAKTNSSAILKNISSLIGALKYAQDLPSVNVIYGKAIGLGYTLFGSKTYGADYSFAFCNAEIGPVSSEVGAQMEYATLGGCKEELKQKFAEVDLDPMNSAKGGYVDDVIEPQFVRQYLIGALQMLI